MHEAYKVQLMGIFALRVDMQNDNVINRLRLDFYVKVWKLLHLLSAIFISRHDLCIGRCMQFLQQGFTDSVWVYVISVDSVHGVL